jgi:hypothetical protein
MRRDKVTQLTARHPVPLTGSLDRASDDMPGDEGENDGMPPHRGVLPVLRNQVQQPRDFPVSLWVSIWPLRPDRSLRYSPCDRGAPLPLKQHLKGRHILAVCLPPGEW